MALESAVTIGCDVRALLLGCIVFLLEIFETMKSSLSTLR